MIHIYPSYYKKFRCIANKCPDSCCKGWDVVVDDETNAFYNTVKGEFGDKIKSLTVTDCDGDRIFVPQNGKCPFWNKNMLCDIFINLGEEHLCKTCMNFPRITQDYTCFSEHLLSFACPEAARIMLEEKESYSDFLNTEFDFIDCDYNVDLMKVLLEARKNTAKIFLDSNFSFAENLLECLHYNEQVQNLLNGDYDNSILVEHKDVRFIFDLHSKLEIVSDEWNAILKDSDCRCDISAEYDESFKNLALYYIYRYYLTALDSMDVISTIKRIVCAYFVLGNALSLGESAEYLFTMYSKEVEHSYENSEKLESEFYFNPDFSTKSIENVINKGLSLSN